GDELRVRAGVQRQLEQVAAVQTEVEAAARPDVADGLEPRGELVRCLNPGQEDHVMYLPRPAVALVDRADLARDHKARRVSRLGVRQAVRLFERIYALPCGFELLMQLCAPRGMGEVARPDKADALAARPPVQVGRVAVAAGRAGKA